MNVYYTVTVNGTALTIVSISYEEEMFDTGSFTLIMKNDKDESTQTNYDTCVGAAGVSGQGKDVVISRKGTEVFTGVCDNVKIGNKLIRISGKGEAIKLAWDSCTEWQEYIATAANTVMTNLLSGTLITLDSSDFTSNINVGYQEGENKFRALYGLVKNYLDGECYVSGGKFFAKTAMGTDKSATVTLEHGENIISLSREIDSFDLANSVKTKGVGEGTFQLTSGPATDATSQAAYNTRKLIYDARRVYNQSELNSIKTKLLADLKDPIDKLEKVLFLDKGDYGLVIGDTVTITNSRLGVSGTYRIFGMKKKWDTQGEIVTATISNTSRSVEKEIANLSYRLDIEKFYPQGSPLWIPIGHPYIAVDDVKDITHKFEIPDESDWNVTINSGKVSIFGDAYRIWAKGGAAGGAASAGGGGSPPDAGTQVTLSTKNVWYSAITMQDSDITADTSKIMVTINGYLLSNAYSGDRTVLHFRIKDGNANYHPVSGKTAKVVVTRKYVNYAIKHKHKMGGHLTAIGGHTNEDFDITTSSTDDGTKARYQIPGYGGTADIYTYFSTTMDNTNTKATELDSTAPLFMMFSVTLEAMGQFNGTGDLKVEVKSDNVYGINGTVVVLYGEWWAMGEHTHNPDPGIYTTSNYPVDVELWVNGTKVADKVTHAGLAGGAAFSVRNIDILSQLTTGENTILLKSTGASSLGMLSMSGGSRIYVRSK